MLCLRTCPTTATLISRVAKCSLTSTSDSYANVLKSQQNWTSPLQLRRALTARSQGIGKCNSSEQSVPKRLVNNIVNEGAGTHKPTPFQKKILVWGKFYPSLNKVPERVTRTQMKKAMDIFRVRASLIMVALTFVAAAVMAMIGRKQRQQGQSVTKIALERRNR